MALTQAMSVVPLYPSIDRTNPSHQLGWRCHHGGRGARPTSSLDTMHTGHPQVFHTRRSLLSLSKRYTSSLQIPASRLLEFHATYGSLLKTSYAPLMRKRDKKREKARAEAAAAHKKEVYRDIDIGSTGKRGKGHRQRVRLSLSSLSSSHPLTPATQGQGTGEKGEGEGEARGKRGQDQLELSVVVVRVLRMYLSHLISSLLHLLLHPHVLTRSLSHTHPLVKSFINLKMPSTTNKPAEGSRR